jgi:iron complex transport system ATP-binding protein
MGTIIKASKLMFAYKDQMVLNELNIEIPKGAFTAIVGPNGCGKTTFVKHLIKSLNPKSGELILFDKPLSSYSHKALGKVIAYVPQATQIGFDFTVEEVVQMGRYPHLKRFQSEQAKDQEIIEAAMKATGVWTLRHKQINALSGGEQQRVIIAKALAQEPQILILDEPISHLDLHHQLELMELIRDLSKVKKITVIAIIHDLNLAMDYSDYVMMMAVGRVYYFGDPILALSAHNIKAVYNLDVCMIQNPVSGNPHIIPQKAV